MPKSHFRIRHFPGFLSGYPHVEPYKVDVNATHITKIAHELTLGPNQVMATVKLLEEGGTVPFIASYRKEATGSLDEVAITDIRGRMSRLQELDKRRETILKSLEERDLLTEEQKEKILAAETLTWRESVSLCP